MALPTNTTPLPSTSGGSSVTRVGSRTPCPACIRLGTFISSRPSPSSVVVCSVLISRLCQLLSALSNTSATLIRLASTRRANAVVLAPPCREASRRPCLVAPSWAPLLLASCQISSAESAPSRLAPSSGVLDPSSFAHLKISACSLWEGSSTVSLLESALLKCQYTSLSSRLPLREGVWWAPSNGPSLGVS